MQDPDTWNTISTTLALLAIVAVFALAGVGAGALLGGRRARRFGTAVADRISPRAHHAALAVAVVAVVGSLGYSEVFKFVPCVLCWDQRICMFALVPLLAVAVVRGDRKVYWYAVPFVTVGIGVAIDQWLLERRSVLAPGTISGFVPCGVPPFETLGFVTLAFMDFAAFSLIVGLLVVAFIGDRRVGARDGASSDPLANL